MISERQTKSLLRSVSGDTRARVDNAKAALRYVNEFCDAGMSRELAGEVRNRNNADEIDL